MTGAESWETIIDERITLARQCHNPELQEAIKDMLARPTHDDVAHDGSAKDLLRALHEETVRAGRKAYDKFHGAVEAPKTEKPDEEAWEHKIGSAAVVAKDKMLAALDKMADAARDVVRGVPGGDGRVEDAEYFTFCVNGYVHFIKKVNGAFELVYDSRKGGQQRIWTALDTAGRTAHEAEEAALKWVSEQDTSTPPTAVKTKEHA